MRPLKFFLEQKSFRISLKWFFFKFCTHDPLNVWWFVNQWSSHHICSVGQETCWPGFLLNRKTWASARNSVTNVIGNSYEPDNHSRRQVWSRSPLVGWVTRASRVTDLWNPGDSGRLGGLRVYIYRVRLSRPVMESVPLPSRGIWSAALYPAWWGWKEES